MASASAEENKRRKKSSAATIRRLTEMTEPARAGRYKYPLCFVSVLLCVTSVALAVTLYLLVARSEECGPSRNESMESSSTLP